MKQMFDITKIINSVYIAKKIGAKQFGKWIANKCGKRLLEFMPLVVKVIVMGLAAKDVKNPVMRSSKYVRRDAKRPQRGTSF